jgi:hypothetical protein
VWRKNMKKQKIVLLISVIVALFMLAGCGKTVPAQPTESIPTEDVVEAYVTVDIPLKPPVVKGNVEALAGRYRAAKGDGSWDVQPGISQIKTVSCSVAESKATIQFTVKNPTDNDYTIGGENPTNNARQKGIQFNVNNKRIKRADAVQRCKTETLPAKGSVTCTVERGLNKYVTDGLQKEQSIRVVAPKWSSRVLFLCPE